jgi:predicted outer membrane repeat protein
MEDTMKNITNLCALLSALLLLVASASGGTHVVDLSGGSDYLTIQEGITAAVDGDTVLVAPGTYTGVANRDLDFEGKDIVLVSQEGPELTVIDCEAAGRGILFQSGEGPSTRLSGFTVTNASDFFGAGIYCVGASPSIDDCAFTSNTAAQAGGAMLIVANSSPAITDCVFVGNSAHDATGSGGGAVYCEQFSTPTFTSCTFEGNTADLNGGAVCVFFAGPTFQMCVFRGNSASNLGGCIMAGANASPTLDTCTFVENEAYEGAVMFASQSPGAVFDCVLALNEGGGTVACADCDPEITHCCVFENAEGDSLCGYHHDDLLLDPLFCDPPAGDYLLHNDSPCLPGYNPWGEQIGATGAGDCGTGIESEAQVEEDAIMLRAPFPNPFRGSITIDCVLPTGAGDLEISVYTVSGKLVQTVRSTGTGRDRRAVWDARDQAGHRVPSGVYFIRAACGTREAAGKVLLVR